ncbi:reverse transcriptase domain-containing protein [Tanacetum coccineum]
MEDHPLPVDASPTALSPGYIADFDSNKEEEEHLASADPSDETMTTLNQGMSVEEIERVVAQRVANAIEAIVIYKTKTNMARKSMSQTEQQEDKVAENASNKRKWERNHNGSSSQQNKGHKVPRAHTTRPIDKKAYAGSLPLCNQCKFHHNGSSTVKCGNCKKVGHIIQNCKTPATTRNQQTRTYYECGSLRHYKSECPIVKFQNRVDMYWKGKARGDFISTTSNINIQ